MTARTAAIGLLALLLLALTGAAAMMVVRGVTGPAVTGLFVGVALGGLNLLFESLSLTWALKKKPSAMLGVSLGGFGLRLVLVCVLTLVFGHTESVDALSFALAYVASFLAFLVVQVWAVSKMSGRAGASPGKEES